MKLVLIKARNIPFLGNSSKFRGWHQTCGLQFIWWPWFPERRSQKKNFTSGDDPLMRPVADRWGFS